MNREVIRANRQHRREHDPEVTRTILLIRERSAADGYPLDWLTDWEINKHGIGIQYVDYWERVHEFLAALTTAIDGLVNSMKATNAELAALGDIDWTPSEFRPYRDALRHSGLYIWEDYERIQSLIRLAGEGAHDNFLSIATEKIPRVNADALYRDIVRAMETADAD